MILPTSLTISLRNWKLSTSPDRLKEEGMKERWERAKQCHRREWHTNRTRYILTMIFFPVLFPIVALIHYFGILCCRIGDFGRWISWKF
jgi:hypothetical protein